MARMSNGMAGFIQGKIGNLVYYVKNGKQMVRETGKVTKPPTLPQLQNRMELAVVVAFLRPLTELINVGFIVGSKDYHKGKTSYNLAVACNKPNAVKGVYPDVVMDFTKVLVANGNIDMAMLPAVGGARPKQACAISERPDPTSPAMPTISPARSANVTFEKAPS